MYICICNAVTENAIRQCVKAGTCSFSDLQGELGVAAGCGSCTQFAVAILDEELERAPATA
jgi:bacterioferritin-associated ferredoxin